MLAFKDGVDPQGAHSATVLALLVAASVFADRKAELVVTSICDGDHGHKSLHRYGLAVDVRTRHLNKVMVDDIVDELHSRLPGYDVVLEHDHIHIEYDP